MDTPGRKKQNRQLWMDKVAGLGLKDQIEREWEDRVKCGNMKDGQLKVRAI